MPDPRINKFADILVNYSIKVQPGEWIMIMADIEAMDYVYPALDYILKAGGNPSVKLYSDRLNETFMKSATEEQLLWISPSEQLRYEKVDAIIYMRTASNTRSLTGVPTVQQQRYSKGRQKVEIVRQQRTAEGNMRWVVSQPPCNALAQDADMSLSEYEDFVFGACYADKDDPVSQWLRIHDEQQRLVDWLKGKKHVTVKGPHIDMTLSIQDRIFLNADGRVNMPDGEIFTGPVEDSVNGWVKFTYPGVNKGREVEGIQLEFKDGQVVNASASKNEDFLIAELDTDHGARYLGEFAIGTNYNIQQFTKSILYDEKIGGTLHMALGASYPQTGAKNISAIHWDLICDMRTNSEIHVDGDLIYKDGHFVI